MIVKWYYSPRKTCRSFWTWLYTDWRLNAISGGYEWLGQHREIGWRLCGVEHVWFDGPQSQKAYERTR